MGCRGRGREIRVRVKGNIGWESWEERSVSSGWGKTGSIAG